MRAYGHTTLDAGIRSRFIGGINGLHMHMLEAGHETPGRPTLLLLHGFPELAYSWRRVMVPLAAAGYHVIAPDQRGYGRTSGADTRFDCDLAPYRMANLVRDVAGLIAALGIDRVAAVIGHDFGASVAGWCGLLRPDLFPAVVIMSAPFSGAPSLPKATAGRALTDAERLPAITRVGPDLARLDRPRLHYQTYYTTREADANMCGTPGSVHAFLRAYYHHKSADWPGNRIYPLAAWTAAQLAKMPTYYIMDAGQGMAETVAPHRPLPAQIADCRWLPDAELAVYAAEYERTGFQGGLNWYRSRLSPEHFVEDQLFGGRTIDVPMAFMAGASDWGVHQSPGTLERLENEFARDYRGTHLIPGAGHWVQQEQPDEVVRRMLAFLKG